MSKNNSISLSLYEPFSTTALVDEDNPERMSLVDFETLYPGGLYGAGTLRIDRDTIKTWGIMKVFPYRVVARNGLKPIYEGWVDTHERVDTSTAEYIELPLVGAFGKIAMRRGIRRLFADNRITDGIWFYNTEADGAELCSVDRSNRIRFTPKSEAWANGNSAIVQYTAPTGEKIKRITYNYDLQEGAQAWEIYLYGESAGIASGTQITASGTGSVDHTFSTAEDWIRLLFISRAAQTPPSDGTIYGQFSGIMVYGETGNSGNYAVYGHQILQDALSEFSDEINSSTNFITTTNTLNITPFITQGGLFEYLAAYMSRAAGFGDASNNPWAWGFRHSESIANPNGKPPVYYEQQPALTDFDFQLRLDEQNLVGGIRIVRPFDAVINRLWVNYTDLSGIPQSVMYSDESTLQAADSQARYEIQESVISLGQTSSTAAIAYAKRLLAKNKYSTDLLRVEGAIQIKGYLRNKYGLRVPASEVTAGKRIRLINFLDGFNDISSQALTMLISRTQFNTGSDQLSITVGKPDSLDVELARMNLERGRNG